MGRRSRKYRKLFACGHRGFGETCQQCVRLSINVQTQAQELERCKHEKQQWQQTFADDLVDLSGLPKYVVLKVRKILQQLCEGDSYRRFKGKRFHFDRTLISIPVTYDYRLLCREDSGKLVPLKVLSHEAYNAIAHNQVKLN